ncbi:MAG: hypothetical protein HKN39_07410 [Flavobacteriales bacterium]|nr:hypothetical protein [Flavobacteriales bacterium]
MSGLLQIFAAIGSIVGAFSVLLIFLDYHKKSNIHKAIIFVGGFLAFVLVGVLFTKTYGLAFAFSIPLLMFLFILMIKVLKKY